MSGRNRASSTRPNNTHLRHAWVVTPEEYARAVRIARQACRGRHLSAEDREEVEQDAAVEAWRSADPLLVWWVATGSAIIREAEQAVMVDVAPARLARLSA